MSIIVNKKLDEEEESLKKSEYIICPECKESSRIIVDNYKFGFYDCKNNHKIDNILINDFENTQNINEAKIKCENCNKINKSTLYNNIFFICYDCKKNICQLCKSLHDKTHNIIDYDDRFFICDLHNESYNSYCMDCKKDICITCEMEHNGHKIITYGSILPNVKEVKEETNNFNIKKEELKNNIKEIINKLNNLINSIDNYFSIYQDILNSYNNKKRNYFLLQNIHDMIKFNKNIIEDLNKIKNEKNFNIKINDIFDIYDKMNPLKKDDKYKNKEENNLNNIKKDIYTENKEDEKKEEKKENINNDEQISNDEDIHNNNKIIELNKELWLNSEKNENNDYKDFDVSKIKKILTFKTEFYDVRKIFVLKDGRIFVNGSKKNSDDYLTYVFDLKNDNILNLKFSYYVDDIIEMDDGIVAILDYDIKKILLIDIRDKDFEIIQTLDKFDGYNNKFFKLINQKIMVIYEYCSKIKTYIYENKKLILVNEKKISSTKKFTTFYKMCLINEKEIVLDYSINGIFSDSYYICFFDLEKDKKIQSFKSDCDAFGLINKDLFIYTSKNKLYPIHLKNHNKKKEFKIEKENTINNILSLNEHQFIASSNYNIYQFELDKNNNFIMIHEINLDNDNLLIYPKNRLMITKINSDEDMIEINLYC